MVNYVISIIENLGGDVSRQCYWDVGRWSDLWRVWRMAGDERPLSDGIDFQVKSITHSKVVKKAAKHRKEPILCLSEYFYSLVERFVKAAKGEQNAESHTCLAYEQVFCNFP